jgi:hypothetical protein
MAKKQPKVVDFKVGDSVFVNTAKTNDQDVPGVIVDMAKGWFNVQVAEGKPISVRAGSLKARSVPAVAPANDNSEILAGSPLETKVEASTKGDKEESKAKSLMAATLNQARKGYVHAKRPDGRSTSNNGDSMARALLEMDPVQVVQLAEVICNIPAGQLVAKYQHLNPGQKRMNAGNRIRACVRHMNDVKANSSDKPELEAAMNGLDRIDMITENPFDVLAAYAETTPGELVIYPID